MRECNDENKWMEERPDENKDVLLAKRERGGTKRLHYSTDSTRIYFQKKRNGVVSVLFLFSAPVKCVYASGPFKR